VLAGGGSTRFGQDKALVEFDGKPMLARMVELLRGVAKSRKVVAVRGKYEPSEWNLSRIGGRRGAARGIITALEDAAASAGRSEWNLILSCDMPFLTREWLGFLSERRLNVRRTLCSRILGMGGTVMRLLPDGCGRALRAAFESGVRRVTQGLQHVTTEVLDEADWKRFDSAGRLFWNMNTPADYEKPAGISKWSVRERSGARERQRRQFF